MSTGTPPEVSVIVACRNEARHIRKFMDSVLAQQTHGIEWELLIADGMSDDGTSDLIRDYARRNPQVRPLENSGKIVSTGLNTAIRAANGEIIIRMDAHTEYQSDYIRKCVDTLRATDADNVGGPARTRAESYIGRAIAAAYHSRFSTGGGRFHQVSFEGYVDTVTYGCWYKTTLERLGLFDETLVRNQDDELNLRLIRQGGRIWQSPRIVSWYHLRSSLSGLFRQYYQYGFWKVPVIRKHRIPASWRHLVPGCFLIWIVTLGVAAVISWMARSPLLPLSLGLLAGTSGIYLLACIAASLPSSRRDWTILPVLPWVFMIYHFSYGLGFLFGMIYWPLHRSKSLDNMGSVLAGVTR